MFINCFVGEWAATSVGTNFTPHVITVNAGEVCYIGETDRRIALLSFEGNIFIIHFYHCQSHILGPFFLWLLVIFQIVVDLFLVHRSKP